MYRTFPSTLRALVFARTGQDLRRCSHCSTCSASLDPNMDVSLETLVQLIVMNDEEVLTTRTLWLDTVLETADQACASGLELSVVIRALRAEAERRGLHSPIQNGDPT